jgi:glyoxylase-like metal-dependent hydrolase (beta-lactamase superfamily II)
MKLVLRVVTGILLLGLLAVVALLVPAHLQIQGVEPDLPSEGQLRELLDVADGPVRVSYIATSSQFPMGHTSVMVEWADGRLMMIDAGMDEAAAREFAELVNMAFDRGEPAIHGTISELLGDDIERVQAVGFTHLHIDHTQGVLNFCESRGAGAAAVQTQYQINEQNFNTEEGAEIIAASCLESLQLEGDGLIAVPGFPGVAVFPLGGHTPGSSLFAVADGERLLLLSGDITNSKEDVLSDQDKGFVYSYLIVPENTDRTTQLRRWLRDLDSQSDIEVVVSHDLENNRDSLPAFN